MKKSRAATAANTTARNLSRFLKKMRAVNAEKNVPKSKAITWAFSINASSCESLANISRGQKNWDKSLVLLAEQFLRLKISLPPNEYLPIGDIADYKSNFYLYFGPFASIFLVPFVSFFGKNTPQYIIGIFSMIASFFIAFQIARKFKFKTLDSLWLSLFFVFSTVLFSVSVMNISAFQVQALGVPFVLLALNEYFGKKRGF